MDIVRLIVALSCTAFAFAVARSGSDRDPRRRLIARFTTTTALLAGPAVAWAAIEVCQPLLFLFGAGLLGAGLAAVQSGFQSASRSFVVVTSSGIVGFLVVVVMPSPDHSQARNGADLSIWPQRVVARGEPSTTVVDLLVDPTPADFPGIIDATTAARPDASMTLARRSDLEGFDRSAFDWRRSASSATLIDLAEDLPLDDDQSSEARFVALDNFATVVVMRLRAGAADDAQQFFAAFDDRTSVTEKPVPPFYVVVVDRAIDLPAPSATSTETQPADAESRGVTFLDECRARRIGVLIMPAEETVRRAFDGVVAYRVGPLEKGTFLRLTIGRSDVKARAIAVDRPSTSMAKLFEKANSVGATVITRAGGNGPRLWFGFLCAAAALSAIFEAVTRRRFDGVTLGSTANDVANEGDSR